MTPGTASDSDSPAPGTLASAPIVGREREQAMLRDGLAAALAGRGALVLIGGEAGLGKTTLAEVLLAEAAAQGATVLIGRCYDLSETPPYGPWAEALGRAPRGDELPALPTAVLPPEEGGEVPVSQEAIFRRVQAYLATLAATRPLVLLLDDLHWADPASLDLLRIVARGLADLPLLLLATYRADEVAREHPLHALLPLLIREARAQRIDLRPLDAFGLHALVRARCALTPGDADRLVAYLGNHSEGNPLYASELLRAAGESGTLSRNDGGWYLGNLAAVGVPTLLRLVIEARVDRLGEATRGLLMAAAVVGQVVPLDLWATVADVGEDALLDAAERAVAARLLVETETGVRFAHALIREALYLGIPGLRRRVWHRRAGEALIARANPDPDAVAHHFRAAGDARATEWLVRAGERAQRAYAWLTAAARYEAALELLEAHGSDPGARAWLLYRLGRLHRLARPELGMRYLDAAASAAEADRALAAWIVFDRGVMRCEAGDYRGGLDEMTAGAAAFDALPPAERATIDTTRATWLADIPPPEAPRAPGSPLAVTLRPGVFALRLAVVGRYDEALTAGARALAAARAGAPGDPLQLASPADADYALGIAHAMRGRPAESRAAFGRARRQFLAQEHHLVVGSIALSELDLVLVTYQADDPAGRQAIAAEGERALARAGGLIGDRPTLQPLVPVLVLAGQWAEARDRAATSPRDYARTWLGFLALAQGDTALAEGLVREGMPDGPATEPGGADLNVALTLQRVAAALARQSGDLPTTRAWLDAHDRWLAWSGAVLGRAEGALGWADYHRAMGDLDAARTQAESALAHAADPRQPLALLAAHRFLGELDVASKRYPEAQMHLDQAVALADACANPYERALTLLATAELDLAEGKADATIIALDNARTILTPLEATPALARADALAQRLAAPPPTARAEDAPFGLTAREVEVLRLVAEGLTDAQIGERLFVSRHTINAHLRGVYGKLGVNTRTAAARLATEHGIA